MAHVDPDDDSIRRFVIYHYAYDPARRQRRHRLVAAYDDVAEFESELDQMHQHAAGIDGHEHWTGMVKEPGHDRRARAAHLVRRCSAHGVRPPEEAMLVLAEAGWVFSSSTDSRGEP